MTFWEILLLFFSFQSFLLGFFLFIKNRGYSYANRLFALFLFLFGYGIFYVIVHWSGYDRTLKLAVAHTFNIAFALFGPLFYFYVRNVVTSKKVRLRDIYHFLPLVLVLICYGGYFILPLEKKLEVVDNGTHRDYILVIPYLGYMLAAGVLSYGLYAYGKFVNHYHRDKDLRVWLRATNLSFILFGLSFILYYILLYRGELSKEFDYIISYAMVVFVGLASYFCIIQPEVFNGRSLGRIIPFVKYETSGLPLQFAQEMKARLKELMQDKKPHLNADLNLDELSAMLNLSRHHASQLINEHFHLNFYEFINRYRIQEAKALLKGEKALSVEEVAFKSGFNNRISFYRAFKKSEGLSPTKFRDHVLAS